MILPANTDAERLILGSIVIADERFPEIAGVLDQKDFSLEKHKRIFARMQDLYARGEGIDRLTLSNELETRGQLQSVDGLSYLVSLDEGLPQIPNLDAYVRIVKDKSLLRQTMFTCQKIIDQCALADTPSQEILDTAAVLLDSVRGNNGTKRGQWTTPGEVLRAGIDSVLFPARGGVGLGTPWPRLTEMTSGWKPGELIVVAGRPGMGKTVIGMQHALTAARNDISVAYISLEMSKESLVRRLVAGISRVDAHRARSGRLTDDERRRMLEAATDLDGLPLFIYDAQAHTPAMLSAALRRLVTKRPVGLLIVDHLQLMKVSGRAESRHHELSEICHGFKRLARQLGCVVMLLSQLNRTCEQERRRPNLSDLKESGSIEEDADTVAFVHRPERYKRDDPSLRGKAELIVAKQRDGARGTVALTFLHGYQIFEEAAHEIDEFSVDE